MICDNDNSNISYKETEMAKEVKKPAPGNDVNDRIKKVIEEIRPMLQNDGGDVEFVEFANGIAKVRLKGACAG